MHFLCLIQLKQSIAFHVISSWRAALNVEKDACMLYTCEDTTHSLQETMMGSVLLSVPPKQWGCVEGRDRAAGGGGVRTLYARCFFVIMLCLTLPISMPVFPPSSIQRVTLSHKFSQRWQWHVCAQAELLLRELMWRKKMVQGGHWSLLWHKHEQRCV